MRVPYPALRGRDGIAACVGGVAVQNAAAAGSFVGRVGAGEDQVVSIFSRLFFFFFFNSSSAGPAPSATCRNAVAQWAELLRLNLKTQRGVDGDHAAKEKEDGGW